MRARQQAAIPINEDEPHGFWPAKTIAAFFLHLPHSPGKQSPGLFSDPAQIPENAVLAPQPFVFSQQVRIWSCRDGLVRNCPNPFAESDNPTPKSDAT